MGVPWGWLMLVSVAVKVVAVPWAGFGDTVAGDRVSVGGELDVPQPPLLSVSLYTVSLVVAYRQPSGPITPEESAGPFARDVVVNGLVVMSTDSRMPFEFTISDWAAPVAWDEPTVTQKSELIPDRVVIAGGDGWLVPATWTMLWGPV
jgi:hypothetical protein